MTGAREFYYNERHLIEDRKLHEPILADGDEKAARAISDKVAKRLGLTDAEIAALHKPLQTRDFAPLPKDTRGWWLREFDPNQPRDETGKWVGVGGGEDSGGGGSGDHPGAGYSKDAYVKGGVIHTSDVNDAARALHENKRVELDQPRKISTLINKLGQMAKDAIAKGEKAPLYNLCNVSVAGTNLFCAESKGIPRVEMPQLNDAQTKQFTTHLSDLGFDVKESSTPASHLRATQNELNGAKVAKLAGKMRAEGGMGVKRIFVSRDDYILDGHHHWAAKVGLDAEDGSLTNDTKINIYRVDISITKLLEEAEKFTGGKGKQTLEGKDKRFVGEVLARLLLSRAFDPSQPRDETGKWVGIGGGEDSSGGDGGGDKLLLVSERPNDEKLDRWRAQLESRSKELEDQGQSGNEEDDNIGRMQMAINAYMQEPDTVLDVGMSGLNAVYDGDGKLLAAAFTYVDIKKVAIIQTIGALDRDAGVKALNQVVKTFGDNVGRIEGDVWVDDLESIAMFERAGFKMGEPTEGGRVTMSREDIPGAKPKPQEMPEHAARMLGTAQKAARMLGYDPALIETSMEEHRFKVGNKNYKAGGLAYLETGRIVIFPREIEDTQGAVGITAHEVAHQKYETVLRAVDAETAKMFNDPETRVDGAYPMRPDGSLTPPGDAKYPLYTRFLKHSGDAFHKRADDDGVTEYSKDYWKNVKTGAVKVSIAQHETIAEMARREAGGITSATPVWRSYYDDVMKTYDELRKAGGAPAPPQWIDVKPKTKDA